MSGCAHFLTWLEANPPLEGHLSVGHGFLSPSARPERLPSEYEPWDEMARALPELFFSNRTRALMDTLPVLSAHEDGLPSRFLARASVVLSALGHAYWRFGAETFYVERTTQVPTSLPEPILRPWQEVSRRLGRVHPERPFQSFYDLFLHNYRIAPHLCPESPALVENIELLVPTFGNETERIFYGAFIEMHVHFAPVVRMMCELEDSVREDRPGDVVAALGTLEQCFVQASRVWAKIGPRPGAPFFCDPVMWAKTVAILGVPPALCPQGGTSGACAPIIYLLDALLGRQRYDSYYGHYVKADAAPMVPGSVHALARCVSEIGLMDYVAERARGASGSELDDAVRSLLDAYVGPRGWLGRHASKAFSYLCISTMTGRNASVSGHERYFSRQTWERAAQNLDVSRVERAPGPVAAGGGSQPQATDTAIDRSASVSSQRSACPFGGRLERAEEASTRSGRAACLGSIRERPADHGAGSTLPPGEGPRVISRSELARHTSEEDLWIAIDGTVYDVSEYAKRHPGGPAILYAYAGRDVSAAFWQQNLHQPRVVQPLLAKLAVGQLAALPETAAGAGASSGVEDCLLTLIRGRQAARLAYRHAMEGDPRMKLFSDEHAHLQLWCDVLPTALEHLRPGLAQRLTASFNARSVLSRAQWLSAALDFRGATSPPLRCGMARRCASLRTNDLALLDRLVESARSALECIEKGIDAAAVVEPLVIEVSLYISQYFELMAGECDAQCRALAESIPFRLPRLDLERLSAAG